MLASTKVMRVAGPAVEFQQGGPAAIRAEYATLRKQSNVGLFMEVKEALIEAASREPVSAREMIGVLSRIPAIEFLLKQDCRIPEKYMIVEHESMYLSQYENYLSGTNLELPLSKPQIRIAALLHDIGKSLPDSKSNQHQCTLEVIKDIREALPFNERERHILNSLIANDPIGLFIVANFERQASVEQRQEIALRARSKSLTYTELRDFADLVVIKIPTEQALQGAKDIGIGMQLRAASLGISARSLFNLHRISHSADVAAYTYDAVAYNGRRGNPGIEFMFALNPEFDMEKNNHLFLPDTERGIIKLSPTVDALFQIMEKAVVRESAHAK